MAVDLQLGRLQLRAGHREEVPEAGTAQPGDALPGHHRALSQQDHQLLQHQSCPRLAAGVVLCYLDSTCLVAGARNDDITLSQSKTRSAVSPIVCFSPCVTVAQLGGRLQ